MSKKILFIGHDANRAGAQLVLLNWLKEQKKRGIENYLLLERGGVLLQQYQKYAKVWVWQVERDKGNKILKKIPFLKREEMVIEEPSREEIAILIRELRKERFELIIGNTVASLNVMQKIQGLRANLACYVHELDFSLSMYASEADLKFLAEKVKHIWVVSKKVGDVLQKRCQINENKITLLSPMVEFSKNPKAKSAEILRMELEIPEEAKVVFGCGLAEWRKGTDVFIRVARMLIKKSPDLHFVWLGISDNLFSEEIKAEIRKFDTDGKIHLVPVKSDSRPYFELADIFFLSSREDPFPLVMLEAASIGLQIVGFRGTGGIEDFSEGLENVLVENLEENDAAELIWQQLNISQKQKEEISNELKQRVKGYELQSFVARWEKIESELV